MTTRHRFLGRKDKAAHATLCGESFGGVSHCGLPYSSEWHYQDDDHPWIHADGRAGECGWRLQEGSWGINGIVCSGDREDNMHVRFPASDGELLTGSIPIPTPITVHMQYPKQEAPVDQHTPPGGWTAGHVYPPSDDGGAPTEAAPAYRETEAATERLQNVGVLPTGNEQPEWSRAAGFLMSEETSLNYGPWPVRKFLLPDALGLSSYTEMDLYTEYVEALDRLGSDYSVQVWRVEGKSYRFALVTWGTMNGLTLETACDELAALYG